VSAVLSLWLVFIFRSRVLIKVAQSLARLTDLVHNWLLFIVSLFLFSWRQWNVIP